MKEKNKRELEYVLNQSKKVAIGIAVLFLTVLILSNLL